MSTFSMCDGRYTITAPFQRGECVYPDVPSQFVYYVSVIDNDTNRVVKTFVRNDAYYARLDAIRWTSKQGDEE